MKFQSLQKRPHLLLTSENEQLDQGRWALTRRTDNVHSANTEPPLRLQSEKGSEEGGIWGPIKFNSMVTAVILL